MVAYYKYQYPLCSLWRWMGERCARGAGFCMEEWVGAIGRSSEHSMVDSELSTLFTLQNARGRGQLSL
jgi:hypothetical protein